ncbi:universal stress protein [Alsobacter sp. KACC 23698]|uniref:Universal stress protein n=1 Tax=Alsobacter sp. KACC 23698 TaxID=3149229 RepID=A0AAU7JF39_9HYPH
MYSEILVATDGAPLAQNSVQHAADLAAALGAKLTILTVTEPFHVFSLEVEQVEDSRAAFASHAKAHAEMVLSAAAALATTRDVQCDVVHREAEHPYRAIIEVARERRSDLIVMGSHGRGGLAAVVLGSQTLKVLTHSRTPVLVVRPAQG